MKEGADMRKKKNISKYLFVLPGFCFFAFAMLIPFCMGFHIAFTDWDGVGIKYNFVGLKNFQMIFQDIRVRGPFLNTLEFAVLGTIFGDVIPLTLAMFVNGKYQKLNTVARVAFFIPVCLSSVLTAFLWKFLYHEFFPKIFGWKNILGYSAVQSMLFSALLSSASGIRLVQIC